MNCYHFTKTCIKIEWKIKTSNFGNCHVLVEISSEKIEEICWDQKLSTQSTQRNKTH